MDDRPPGTDDAPPGTSKPARASAIDFFDVAPPGAAPSAPAPIRKLPFLQFVTSVRRSVGASQSTMFADGRLGRLAAVACFVAAVMMHSLQCE